MSRLARNSTDWHRLLEICALTDTLILDEDGIYDPAHFNDRLLLGLKGTMSEAELHVLRARLQGGILNKARRGELECVHLLDSSTTPRACSVLTRINRSSSACAGCLKRSAGRDRRWRRREPRGIRAWRFHDAAVKARTRASCYGLVSITVMCCASCTIRDMPVRSSTVVRTIERQSMAVRVYVRSPT